jgi:hypothetical protein
MFFVVMQEFKSIIQQIYEHEVHLDAMFIVEELTIFLIKS